MNAKAFSDQGQYLTFWLRGQIYAFPVEVVCEINRMLDITAVPEVPAFVAGVMNLRGQVIPVVDLRRRMGLEVASVTKDTCVIVAESTLGQVGLIADGVHAVISLRREAPGEGIESANVSVPRTFVQGVGKHAEGIVMILGIDNCVTGEEMENLRQIVDNKAA